MRENNLLRLVLKMGYIWGMVFLTAISVTASVGITILMGGYVPGEPPGSGLFIALTVPLLVAPPLSITFLRLLSELEAARRAANSLAILDDLTGAHNRRYFFEQAELEFYRARRYELALAVILFDLDDFKQINDQYGHQVGDQVLYQVADLCQESIRRHNVFARYGGEEFVVLLPETDAQAAAGVAERLRQQVSRFAIEARGTTVRVTLSLGVAEISPADQGIDGLIHRADMALYEAKNSGKNSVRRG